MRCRDRFAREDGFSFVELLVAALVLLIGLLGTVSLIDGANNTASATNGRIAGTNLTRELVEYARAADYDQLTDAQLPGTIQARPNMGGGSTNPFTVERRNVTYTVTLSACVYDDPKDGLGAKPAGTAWCPTAAALAGTPADKNPEDFRRVTFALAWSSKGRPGSMTQSALIPNPSGGLGPRVISLVTEPPSQITSPGSLLSYTATTDSAAAVRWTVDAPGGGGDADPIGAAPATTWTIPWNIGTYGTKPFVVDGIYTLAAQAVNSQGIPGEQKIITIPLNRSRPLAPAGFSGGRNTLFGAMIVDLSWDVSTERDVIGYRVDRRGSDGTWTQVCPATAAFDDATSCTDTDATADPAADIFYRVLAFDRANVEDKSSSPMIGAAAEHTVVGAGAVPPSPTDLTYTVGTDGLPEITWTQPAGGTVRFFRIYRDGMQVAQRYDVVSTSGPQSYTDSEPGAGAHTYYVSAVGDSFNESPLSGPTP